MHPAKVIQGGPVKNGLRVSIDASAVSVVAQSRPAQEFLKHPEGERIRDVE
jgi:hypothetical protein